MCWCREIYVVICIELYNEVVCVILLGFYFALKHEVDSLVLAS